MQKAESLFLTYLCFKAFGLVEHKMPSSGSLFENTVDYHRKFKEDLGDIRVTHLVTENVRLKESSCGYQQQGMVTVSSCRGTLAVGCSCLISYSAHLGVTPDMVS